MPEGVKYQILRMDKAGCPPVIGFIFTDPAEAARISKNLSREMGEKLCVKPILNDRWRDRETDRFLMGTYRSLPWYHMDWWRSDASNAIHKDHFAHPSLERPGFLAYTKSPEDGMMDKQTIVRPGAYLKKYFERSLNWHGIHERTLVTLFMDAYGPLEVKFASTEAEIISTYENGPETCMMGKEWPGDGRNPAYIYAAGDLQIAYLGDLDDVSARTLVWPERKTYSRVYGDIARLTKGLDRLGYKWGAPIGARVQRIKRREVRFNPKAPPPSGCFLTPYIDKLNQRGGGHLSVIDKGDHLMICKEGKPGSHHCSMPNGDSGLYVPREDEVPTFACERCDTPGHRELRSVLVTEEGDDEESWCNKCVKRDAFHCRYSGSFYSSETVERVEVDDEPWTKYHADMYAAQCEMCPSLHHEGNLLKINISHNEVKKMCRDCAARKGGAFNSMLSNKLYLIDQRVIVRSIGGKIYAGKPELKYHGFQCDGCDDYGLVRERKQTKHDDRLFCILCDEKIKAHLLVPVSPSRAAFENNRNQLNLIAAE